MVECGSMSEPPNFQNLTIWGIVTLVLMVAVGALSIDGLIWALGFHGKFIFSLLLMIGSGCGVAGLILVILSLAQRIPTYMTIGIFCYLVCCIVHIIYIVFCLIDGADLHLQTIFNLALDIFLCVLFYLQNKGFSPSAA